MAVFLDPAVSEEFRHVINSSPIFAQDEICKAHFNLICVVMDRLDSCVEYLNSHSAPPETEVDFIVFLMFSCMVVDASKMLLEKLDLKNEYTSKESPASYQYFKTVCQGSPLNLPDDSCPTDDKFFEYFRALAFAHPFETSRPKFLQEGEVQYSPWVIDNRRIMPLGASDDLVGIRIYSNKFENWESIKDLYVPFSLLKGYIQSRYVLVEKAKDWATQRIAEARNEWGKHKIDRSKSPVDILKDISMTLEMRYQDMKRNDVDRAILYMEYPITISENRRAVDSYRQAIIGSLPSLCDSVDTFDYETFSQVLGSVLYARPAKMHDGAFYQLEKIASYLNAYTSSGNVEWGLRQAESFSKKFAKDYVMIKPRNMSFEEIKLLVATACFLENRKQICSLEK
jgi:hypothetical protein